MRCLTIRKCTARLRVFILVPALAAGLIGQAGRSGAEDPIKEGFEGRSVEKDINPRFKVCHRPENTFGFNGEVAKSGRQSLELSILPPPTVTAFAKKMVRLNPEQCKVEHEEEKFKGDNYERAEIWEDKTQNPLFGEDKPMFYGFSMRVDQTGIPPDGLKRLVLGQWKASCKGWCDASPFLAQRLTGGFYHITLDVDAYAETAGRQEGRTCKVLLAFAKGRPTLFDAPLALDRPVQCESRLQDPPMAENMLKINYPLEIKREAYLPDPFGDKWTDLVFSVQGGRKDGVTQVWAGGQLIATAKGWIGHYISAGQKQYFKYGPYRDKADYGITVYLDNLARGGTYDEVDPEKF